MKITIVQGAFLPVPSLRGGAVEKVWEALGAEFARRGHEVTHISRKFEGLPDEEQTGGVRHRRVRGFDTPRALWLLKWRDLLYSWRVLRVLPEADILVTNTFWLPILIRSARWGRLYVHIARYPRAQILAYQHAARLQAVSSHIRDAVVALAPALASRAITLPNPIPRARAASASQELRERWLLFVGRIHPEKGIGLLIDALRLVDPTVLASWKVIIVGPSDLAAGGGGSRYLDGLQRSAGDLAPLLEWIGPVFCDDDRLAGYYRKSSLFIYPSLAEHGEACPLAPLEAMAEGCPPLVSDLRCFDDYLCREQTGFVFDHRGEQGPSRLASKLAQLLTNQDLLARVGAAARAKAAEFSLDVVATRYLADMEACCANRPLPVPCPSR